MVGSLTQLAANVQPEPPCTVSEPSAAESSCAGVHSWGCCLTLSRLRAST